MKPKLVTEKLAIGDSVQFYEGLVLMHGILEEVPNQEPVTKSLVKAWPATSPSTVRRYRIENFKFSSYDPTAKHEERVILSTKNPYRVHANLTIEIAGKLHDLFISGKVEASSANEAKQIFMQTTEIEVKTEAKDNRAYTYHNTIENAQEKCTNLELKVTSFRKK